MTTDLVPKPYILDLPNTYDGKALRQPFSDFMIDGVVGINDFLVVPKGGTAANPDAGGASRNRSVDILALGNAAAWILGDDTPNTQGIYRCLGGAVTINEALNTNTSGQIRIDLVTLKVIDASGKAQTTIVQGTPGAGAPALPPDSLMLAQVTCADSFSVIAAAQVTDTRLRAYHHAVGTVPGADVVLTENAWTDICTLGLVTLVNDRTVRFDAKAQFSNTHATQVGLIALRIIDTSQGNAFIVGTGKSSVGSSTSGVPNHAMMWIAEAVPTLAGAHTYKLQAFKTQGTVSVIKTETLASQVLVNTRLGISL